MWAALLAEPPRLAVNDDSDSLESLADTLTGRFYGIEYFACAVALRNQGRARTWRHHLLELRESQPCLEFLQYRHGEDRYLARLEACTVRRSPFNPYRPLKAGLTATATGLRPARPHDDPSE